MDRRKFLITTSVTLTSTVAQWSDATPTSAVSAGGRRIGDSTPDRFERRLGGLRHLDDQLGSGEVHDAARTELRLILSTLKDASYYEDMGGQAPREAAPQGAAALRPVRVCLPDGEVGRCWCAGGTTIRTASSKDISSKAPARLTRFSAHHPGRGGHPRHRSGVLPGRRTVPGPPGRP